MDPGSRLPLRLPLPLRLGVPAWLALARRSPAVARALRAADPVSDWPSRFGQFPDWPALAQAVQAARPEPDDALRAAAAASAPDERACWRALLKPAPEGAVPPPEYFIPFTPDLRARLLRHAGLKALRQKARRDRRRLAAALANTPEEFVRAAAAAAEHELRQPMAAWFRAAGWSGGRAHSGPQEEFEAQALPTSFRHGHIVPGTRGRAFLYGVRPAELPSGLARALAAGAARCLPRRVAKAPAVDHERRVAEELRAAIAEFSAGAGHEINNPLAAILGEAQLLLPGELDPPRRARLQQIAAQARRVHRMIRDLHFIGGSHRTARDAVPLDAAFLHAAAVAAGERFGAITLGDVPAGAAALGDGPQLARLCAELLRNAAAAAGPQGWARIDAEALPGGWRIRVTDSGPGFSAEARRHLLTPYYSGRNAGRGLGMGLPVVARIVADHGGTWSVLPARPTTVVVDLPAAEAAALRAAA